MPLDDFKTHVLVVINTLAYRHYILLAYGNMVVINNKISDHGPDIFSLKTCYLGSLTCSHIFYTLKIKVFYDDFNPAIVCSTLCS